MKFHAIQLFLSIKRIQCVLSFIVNCQWGSWETGTCSKTCGGGTRRKSRSKTVTEQHGGRCEGSSAMDENCNEQHCPSTLYSHQNDYLNYYMLSIR